MENNVVFLAAGGEKDELISSIHYNIVASIKALKELSVRSTAEKRAAVNAIEDIVYICDQFLDEL